MEKGVVIILIMFDPISQIKEANIIQLPITTDLVKLYILRHKNIWSNLPHNVTTTLKIARIVYYRIQFGKCLGVPILVAIVIFNKMHFLRISEYEFFMK